MAVHATTPEHARAAAWPGTGGTVPGWVLTAVPWMAPATAGLVVAGVLVQDVAPLRLVLPAVVILLVMAVRPRPSTAIGLSLVAIVVGAMLRRLTGGPGAFVPDDPLAVLALVAVFPAFGAALVLGRRVTRTAGLNWYLAYVVWVLFTSGLGLAGAAFGSGGSLFARIIGLIIVIVPAGIGYLVAAGRIGGADRLVTRGLVVLPVLAAGYAIAQFFNPPSWDLAWLRSVGRNLTSVGVPEPQGFRVWGPMEAPLPLATLCGLGLLALLVIVVSRRGEPGWVARAVGCTAGALVLLVALLLTSVRSVLFLLPLLLTAMVLLDLIPGARRYGVVLLVVVVGGTAVGVGTLGLSPDSEDSDRYAVGNLSEDTSFQARAELLPNFLQAFANPIGGGAGSSGLAQRLEEGGAPVAVDNGYLTLALEGGLVQLVLFCGVVGIAIVRAARKARRDPRNPTALMTMLVILYFALLHTSADVVSGSLGVVFWIFVGAALYEPAATVDDVRVLPAPDAPPAAPRTTGADLLDAPTMALSVVRRQNHRPRVGRAARTATGRDTPLG